MLPIEQLLGRYPRRVGRPPARVPVAPPPPPPPPPEPEPELEPEEIIKHPRKSQAMPQISIALDSHVIDEIDMRAQVVGISRSKWIATQLNHVLYNVERADFEAEKLGLEIQHLQQLLAERDRVINEMYQHRQYLEGLIQHLSVQRLPEPRAGFWARLFGRD